MPPKKRYHCHRCSYDWHPKTARADKPKECPNCKSRNWHKPKP